MTRHQIRNLKRALKTQGAFLVRLLFSEVLTILVLWLLFSTAQGADVFPEPLTIGSYELGRGIVAPGAMATIHGRAFTTEAAKPLLADLPTELSSVRVWLGGREKGLAVPLRYVGYDEIAVVMPAIPKAATWWYGWQRVEVDAPLGFYVGWVVVMPTSAEIFTNRCLDSPACTNGMPFGGAWVNLQQVFPTLNLPIPNQNTKLWFYGSGFRNAARVVAWLTDELGGEVLIECHAEAHAKFAGWDVVSFGLPATIPRNGVDVPLQGEITIQLLAQQPLPMRWWSLANPVKVQVLP